MAKSASEPSDTASRERDQAECGDGYQAHGLITSAPDGRRTFLSRLSVGLGALTGAAVAVGPVGVALHPLLDAGTSSPEQGAQEGWLKVAPVDRFTVGGPPQRVVLTQDKRDAWLTLAGMPVGAVLIQRTATETFRVFSAICPHLGCSVSYQGKRDAFVCPCHQSSFELDGARQEQSEGTNPSPRALDRLETRIEGAQLWVRWLRYKTGTKEQIVIG